jgi:hypothetical protein
MISFIRVNGGMRIDFDTREGCGHVVFDHAGQVVESQCRVKPEPLPVQKMPADFDPETESRRMKQGGCCGQSTE